MTTERFSCGIDIGEINMAIAFVSPQGRVINYRGAVTHAKATALHEEVFPHFTRHEIGMAPSTVVPKDQSADHICFIQFLQGIPEFQQTDYTTIEMQLASNKSTMSRLDGIVYGWLIGRYPSMLTTLNGSTCRKKAIENFFKQADIDPASVDVGHVLTKHKSKEMSFKFVKAFHPECWDYYKQMGIKLDDVCDTLVYAAIAFAQAHPHIGPRSKKRAPTAGFEMPVAVAEPPKAEISRRDVALLQACGLPVTKKASAPKAKAARVKKTVITLSLDDFADEEYE